MKKSEIKISVTIFKNLLELSAEDKMLMNKAETRENAYAPYSNFSVGAALLLENNQLILGNNQENAAYPSGMCAERIAIWKAGSDYPNINVKKLAITASSLNFLVDKPVAPVAAVDKHCLSMKLIKKKPLKFCLWEK